MEVKEVVFELIKRIKGIEKEEIKGDSDLVKDFGFDSLEVAELVFWLDLEYGPLNIRAIDLKGKTTNDIMNYTDPKE